MDREILCKAKRVRYGDYIIGGILMIDEKKLLEKLRIYISYYAKPPYGREVEGTVELLKEAADAIEALSDKPEVDYDGEWIPCSERLPEEHDSIFAKFKGTDKWSNAMFEKISNEVNVTIEFENGKRAAKTLHTIDGKWNEGNRGVKFKVIAWQHLPEEYKK